MIELEKIQNSEGCKISRIVNIPISKGEREVIGNFISFVNLGGEDEKGHFAIGLGDWENVEVPHVRIHSECITGDVFNSERCDCGDQLAEAIDLISDKSGFILYLRQEGRGIGFNNKMAAYALQDEGYDTYEANHKLGFEGDLRKFDVAASMLKALGISKIYLHTNNSKKIFQLKELGISIIETVNTKVYEKTHNRNYLLAKKNVAGHNLDIK